MKIKKIGAYAVLDSRKEKTICVSIKTPRGKFVTFAPTGKSTGKYEAKSYASSLEGDIDFINGLNIGNINKILERRGVVKNSEQAFNFLGAVEKLVNGKIGGNSLFALEASLLKALAYENGKELWEFLRDRKKRIVAFPRPVGNAIGGGLHSVGRGGKKPDFQEFLFIADGKTFRESVKINNLAYKLSGKLLGYWIKKRNDEGGFGTNLSNE